MSGISCEDLNLGGCQHVPGNYHRCAEASSGQQGHRLETTLSGYVSLLTMKSRVWCGSLGLRRSLSLEREGGTGGSKRQDFTSAALCKFSWVRQPFGEEERYCSAAANM